MSSKSIVNNAMKVIALLYAFTLLYITMISSERYQGNFEVHNINLQPFVTKWRYIRDFSTLRNNVKVFIVKEILGNCVLFVPFSWFVHTLFGKQKKIRTAIILVLVVLCIENLQYWLHIGTFDIDDIILNVSGGLAGIFLFDLLHKNKIA